MPARVRRIVYEAKNPMNSGDRSDNKGRTAQATQSTTAPKRPGRLTDDEIKELLKDAEEAAREFRGIAGRWRAARTRT